MGRRPIVIGNWKMNMLAGEAVALAEKVKSACSGVTGAEIGLAPPFTAILGVAEALRGSGIILAGQNCHYEGSGAFTGEIAPAMLSDLGCTHVLVGHSERRQYFGEDDALVNRKVKAALEHKLTPVICVGEHLEQREAGQTFEVVGSQLEGAVAQLAADDVTATILAYEPVWAIGTGKVATPDQAQEVHAFLRGTLTRLFGEVVGGALRIQYGGSVKPDNAQELMTQPDIDGALVGGASLKADAFAAIVSAANAQ